MSTLTEAADALLSHLRDAPKDVTPSAQVTEQANRRIRERREREADPFARCSICNKKLCRGHPP